MRIDLTLMGWNGANNDVVVTWRGELDCTRLHELLNGIDSLMSRFGITMSIEKMR